MPLSFFLGLLPIVCHLVLLFSLFLLSCPSSSFCQDHLPKFNSPTNNGSCCSSGCHRAVPSVCACVPKHLLQVRSLGTAWLDILFRASLGWNWGVSQGYGCWQNSFPCNCRTKVSRNHTACVGRTDASVKRFSWSWIVGVFSRILL